MYYNEITLLPSLEISQAFLLSKLFSTIHDRLVTLKDSNDTVPIGISFPEYSATGNTLGNKLRLFAQKREMLEGFDIKQTLRTYAEYAHHTSIREVPEKTLTYVQFSRIQPPSTLERIARRKAKRMGISYENAAEMIHEYATKKITLPYVIIKSKSTNKQFSIYIKKEQSNTMEHFTFNTYGLSKGGALPEF
ncbi:MAG TPA: type I-F CRISPR-associated endoribonuclease Cas6/Csy4 [Sphaerochaeta sp.]|nr:type I-F CRISPR-associated endoribonuclease Cas6/Csy4 [Sphaerochaeta sp.]